MIRSTRLVLTTVALLAALTACSGDDGPPTGVASSIDVTTSPASLAVEQGASGTVTVSVTRTGDFTGPVTLAVEGAPAGITATAAPNPVAGATATITVAVAASAPVGNHPLTVRARERA